MVVVRLAEPDEYERVGELTIAAYESLPVDHLWGGYEADILDVAGRAKAADVLVAVDNREVVGAVTFVSDPKSHWLEWSEPGEVQFRLLAVDPALRGRGIGEALVRECMTRADDRPIIIHTTRWMDAAQRIYARLGFVRRPDRDVDESGWRVPSVELPAEWRGEVFLAYSFAS
jgi:ribosomal protein S18 acetylase RimI-like enzyme